MTKKTLKTAILVIAMLGINFVSSNCFATQQDFTDHNGKTIKIEDYKDKTKLFVFIASGCQYCKKEAAVLNKMMDLHKNKLVILGYNIEELSSSELQEFVESWNINFPMLQQEPIDLVHLKYIRGVPTMVIVEPNGNVSEPLVGLHTSKDLETILFENRR